MMALEFLNLLEFVSIPAFDCFILAGTKEYMAFVVVNRVWDKGDLHDAVLVAEECFVAVTEVETPNSDVLIRRTGSDELAVTGN